jgi:hypothetical protein
VTAALDLLASMRLEDGRRWGDAALPEQWEDARELLAGDVRRHYWIRARGRSKTLDAGACILAAMITGQYTGGDELVAAAAGREQAGLVIGKIRGLVERTEDLHGAAEVEIERHKVTARRSGAALTVISSDLSTSWGRTPAFLYVDEIANHPVGKPPATSSRAC